MAAINGLPELPVSDKDVNSVINKLDIFLCFYCELHWSVNEVKMIIMMMTDDPIYYHVYCSYRIFIRLELMAKCWQVPELHSPCHNCWTIFCCASTRFAGWTHVGGDYTLTYTLNAVDAARSAYDRSAIMAWTVKEHRPQPQVKVCSIILRIICCAMPMRCMVVTCSCNNSFIMIKLYFNLRCNSWQSIVGQRKTQVTPFSRSDWRHKFMCRDFVVLAVPMTFADFPPYAKGTLSIESNSNAFWLASFPFLPDFCWQLPRRNIWQCVVRV